MNTELLKKIVRSQIDVMIDQLQDDLVGSADYVETRDNIEGLVNILSRLDSRNMIFTKDQYYLIEAAVQYYTELLGFEYKFALEEGNKILETLKN